MEIIHKLYQEGRKFEKNKSIEDRKAKGVFYTPLEVVDYMVKKTVASLDLVENPYVKILDISCGAGYFLLRCFEALREAFQMHLQEIMAANPELKEKLTYQSIGKFIVENNIWGIDIDEQAVALAKETLSKAAGCGCQCNIICADSLIAGLEDTNNEEPWLQQYDCIIGNPPYIGHKAVPAEYKNKLYKYYKDVYKDKADISYCFFKRGMELLTPKGMLCFITSRYFMEGPSADKLRSFIMDFAVEELVDFGDCRVFADAGVSVCIISISKQKSTREIEVRKIDSCDAETGKLNIDRARPFYIQREYLREDGWLLLEPEIQELFNTIAAASTHVLEDVFDSCQGIITGCDRAFVLSEQQADELGIEKELLKPWIKNSHVEKFFIKPSDKLLIYTDLIEQPERYPRALGFAEAYRHRLMQRRECQKGVRSWYQLQWGRNSKYFDSLKLVYPYKASGNRFAVDRRGLYCSADVYSLMLKKELAKTYSLDYMAALLNSKAMEFYFKCFAKKISPTLYDYYPNKVLKIRLKLDIISEKLEELVSLLYQTQNAAERKCILQAIDREIYKMYDFNENQIRIIENSAGE